jgi:hypothetical protein
LVLIGYIEAKFERINVLGKHFEIHLAVAASSESVKKIVKLRIRDIEIVIEEEFPKGGNADKASEVVVDMSKCFIRLDIFELFACHFHNSKPFDDLHNK